MHYYKFNIADYRKDTAHLSRLEHSIYRDLIDWYYLDEKPIPTDINLVTRKLRLHESEHQSLLNVISDFFEKTEEGYLHKRIEKELEIYQARSLANRENGKKGGKPKQSEPNSNPMGYDSPPNRNLNHKPLTNNQEPLKELVPTVLVETLEFQLAEHDQVQYEKIIDLYHKALPELPRVAKLTTTRRSHVRARWKNDLGDLGAWERFFMIVRDSSFLMGRAPPSHGRTKAFLADFDFLIKESNCIKIVEGKYRDQARRN